MKTVDETIYDVIPLDIWEVIFGSLMLWDCDAIYSIRYHYIMLNGNIVDPTGKYFRGKGLLQYISQVFCVIVHSVMYGYGIAMNYVEGVLENFIEGALKALHQEFKSIFSVPNEQLSPHTIQHEIMLVSNM